MSEKDTTIELAREIATLRDVVDKRLAEDPLREAAFNRLHEELSSYKQSFLSEAERPLLLDLLMFYDTMHWYQQRLEEASVDESLADSFQYLVEELLETLYRRDLVPMDPIERFDPNIHHAVQITRADSPAEDGTVAQTVKRGFLRHGRVFRAEDVVVRKWAGVQPK